MLVLHARACQGSGRTSFNVHPERLWVANRRTCTRAMPLAHLKLLFHQMLMPIQSYTTEFAEGTLVTKSFCSLILGKSPWGIWGWVVKKACSKWGQVLYSNNFSPFLRKSSHQWYFSFCVWENCFTYQWNRSSSLSTSKISYSLVVLCYFRLSGSIFICSSVGHLLTCCSVHIRYCGEM